MVVVLYHLFNFLKQIKFSVSAQSGKSFTFKQICLVQMHIRTKNTDKIFLLYFFLLGSQISSAILSHQEVTSCIVFKNNQYKPVKKSCIAWPWKPESFCCTLLCFMKMSNAASQLVFVLSFGYLDRFFEFKRYMIKVYIPLL